MVNMRSSLAPLQPATALDPVEWIVNEGLVPYADALAFMDDRVADIADGKAPEAVWLLEHPPLYTGGTSAHDEDYAIRVFRCIAPAAAVSSPIMVRGSALAT